MLFDESDVSSDFVAADVVFDCPSADANILLRYFSWKVCNNSQKPGTNRVPTIALIAIPKTTAVPKAIREAAPAPVANNIGITPNTKAKAVIIIGRKRI